MKFSATTTPTKLRKNRALVLFLAEGEKVTHSRVTDLANRLAPVAKSAGFTGKKDQVCGFPASLDEGLVPVILVGMGKKEEITDETLRQGAARMVKQMEAMHRAAADVCLGVGADAAEDPGRAIAEGACLATYRFETYKSEPDKERTEIREIVLRVPPDHLDCAREGLKLGELLARGVAFARDLGNTPGNTCTPTYLAERAKEIAKTPGIKATILDQAQMEKLGMNALLGVSRGSSQPPKLIMLDWHPRDATETVAVVGKGLTFDSGGISLKPGKNMDEMKFDMCGGAAVLGLFSIIAELNPLQRVIGVVPSSENLPDASAQKPGDIVTAYNGKTIEILNTDAEGRLILADALAYVREQQPAAIVDLATLTGAIIMALGHIATGAMSNDDALRTQVVEAGERAGERCWPLPLWPDFHKAIEAQTADIQNIGDGTAGSISGAMFLKEFVGETPWVHLDIAGTAWGGPDVGYYGGKGAAGVGVRLLAQWLMDRAAVPTA